LAAVISTCRAGVIVAIGYHALANAVVVTVKTACRTGALSATPLLTGPVCTLTKRSSAVGVLLAVLVDLTLTNPRGGLTGAVAGVTSGAASRVVAAQ